jgi:hypothetical protein
MSDAFRDTVREYSVALAGLKDLRKRCADLKAGILQYMRDQGHEECLLPDGSRLVRKTARKTEALKKEHIAGEVRKLVADAAAAEQVVGNMYARRVSDEAEVLSLVKAGKARPEPSTPASGA